MTPRKKYYENTSKNLIKQFQKRRIEAYYCENKELAKDKILELLKDGSTVSWGGSMTLQEIDLFDSLKNGNYNLLDRSTAKNNEEAAEIYHQALSADYYLMSSNAITLDGKLVNIDGNGNRLAALIYGPDNVIVVAGMNKVVLDEESALKRVRNEASPINTVRLNKNTPCSITGKCSDCLSDDCICCQTVITRMSRVPNRIKVILIGEELGY
ncbi:lactate utilization protein [Vallitalea guaymasensis]|uniref:Lactate utilization protein n=1 Tax=Vallitalea guaymasensis TaxID=1185412 RepID=A0A8J8SE03_9FIRM|nr:lactate utilization protein [Vallitalea guaymasensis]QUH31254.1 lactate utilization protein [Vallitalea guaymasensis]